MNIILDAMSGDKAPLEIIKGAAMAAAQYSADITLVGDRDVIERTARENSISLPRWKKKKSEEKSVWKFSLEKIAPCN